MEKKIKKVKTELGARSKSIKPEELSRKERVLQLVKSGKCDTVTEISRELSLSKMSVYRYVRTLMGEGKISKTFNKLYPYSAGLSAAGKDSSALSVKCGICSKQITDERLNVAVTYKDGEKQDFCCAHCAVMATVHTISDPNSISSIMGRDFIYGNPLDLRNAFLLLKTGVIPCCSPPILVFARKDDAEKFKKGFGGEIRSFDEIISHMKF